MKLSLSFLGTIRPLRIYKRSRVWLSVVAVVGVVGGFLNPVGSVFAEEEQNTALVGSFNIGNGLMGDIDERSGGFSLGISVGEVSGVVEGVSESGVVDRGHLGLGITYNQDAVNGDTSGGGRFGLGLGWAWNTTFVEVDGGIHVFPSSGGVFDADTSTPSGLARYTLGDLVFSQQHGVLPTRPGVTGQREYAYVLETSGGGKDFFSETGDLIARVGLFGERVDMVWGFEHRLLQVVGANGFGWNVVWDESGFQVVAPSRSDGVVTKTVVEVTANRVRSVTNSAEQQMVFGYEGDGFLTKAVSSQGAVTGVEYQVLPEGKKVVKKVTVSDGAGTVLASREWGVVGEATVSGWPIYQGETVLRDSGDGQFRYETVVSDGVTRVVSTYNGLGLLLSQRTVVSTSQGDFVAQEKLFSFPVPDGWFDPQTLPKQYGRPTEVVTVSRDSAGRERSVVERTQCDEVGRVVNHVGVDGTVTQFTYDTYVLEGFVLPVGLLVEQVTTGPDGVVSKMVNTLTSNRKAVAVSETFVGSTGGVLVSKKRQETIVDGGGFISQERVVATAPAGEGPDMVVTRFGRFEDTERGVVRIEQVSAAGSSSASVSQVVVDQVSGLVVSRVDPVGRVARVVYDTAGRVVDDMDFSGRHTTMVYGVDVKRVRDPRGVVRSEFVDVLGNVVKITDNLEFVGGEWVAVAEHERVVETRMYEQNSSRVTSVDAQGLKTVSVSDVFGRPVRASAPNGITQITEYDDVGNTVTTGMVSKPDGRFVDAQRVSVTRKDDSGRDVAVTGSRKDGVPVPEETTFYDGLGRVVSQTANDVATNVVVNEDGTARTTTAAPVVGARFSGEMVTATREHDLLGASTKKTLTQANQSAEGVSRVFDAAGHVVREVDQAGGVTMFEYTLDGLVSVVRKPGGVVTCNTYDSVTRSVVMSETVKGSEVRSVRFEYDPVTGEKVSVFDPADRVGTEIRYAYDIFGNSTHVFYPDGKTVSQVFDEYGKKTSTTDIAGNVTSYVYDRYGVLVGVAQVAPGGMVLGWVEYVYDRFGRVQRVGRGNGVQTVYTFTSADEIASEETTRGGVVVHKGVYEYDSHGNLTHRVDTRVDVDDVSSLVSETTAYTYNVYNELLRSEVHVLGGGSIGVSGESVTVTEYEVGVGGNVSQETVTRDGGVGVVREFQHNSLNQTTGIVTDGHAVAQEYDVSGNLVRGVDGTSYTYNAYNQLLAEESADGVVTSYTYWVNGQRRGVSTVLSDRDSYAVGLYWVGDILVNDTHTFVAGEGDGSIGAGASVTASYLIGVQRHSRTLDHTDSSSDPVSSYYVTDRHGSVIATTDSGGDVESTYDYTDYGSVTIHTAPTQSLESMEHVSGKLPVFSDEIMRNPFQFSGEYTTPTGVQNLGSRSYNAATFTFTTRDTADLYNLYAYANANPITHTDHTGEDAEKDWNAFYYGIDLAMTILGGISLVPIVGTAWIASRFLYSVSDAFKVRTTMFVDAVASVGIGTAVSTQRAHPLFSQENPEQVTNAEIITYVLTSLSIVASCVLGIASWGAEQAARNEIASHRAFLQNYFKTTGRKISTNENGGLKTYYAALSDEEMASRFRSSEENKVLCAYPKKRVVLQGGRQRTDLAVVTLPSGRGAEIQFDNATNSWKLVGAPLPLECEDLSKLTKYLFDDLNVDVIHVSHPGAPIPEFVKFKKDRVGKGGTNIERWKAAQ